MKVSKLFVAAIATAMVAGTAQAQAGTCGPNADQGIAAAGTICARTHDVTSTVNDIMQLTLSTGSTTLNTPAMVNYGALAANAYLTATPLAAAAGPNVKVVSNRGYDVSIEAQDATFGPAGVSKPAGDVEWKTTAGSFAPLSVTGANVLTSTNGTVDTNTNLSFQSRWAYERDKPGSYSLTLKLTLAAK